MSRLALSWLGMLLAVGCSDTSTQSGSPKADAGAEGGAPCSASAECDDGKACNGVEQCTGGKCAPGTPVQCSNPDPAGCDAACVEPSGSCVVKKRDGDADGHDSICPADPGGDDCDDGDATVYPGAPDGCDGKDNDCDGKDDLQESIPLAGSAKKLVGQVGKQHYDPAIAWCAAGAKYVMAWTDNRDGPTEIWAAPISAGGVLGTQQQVSQTLDPGAALEPKIACNASECVIVWRSTSPTDTLFQRVDCDAKPIGPVVNATETPSAGNGRAAITPFGGNWFVGLIEKDTSGLPAAYRVFDATGAPQISTTFVASPVGLRDNTTVAATATQVAFAWDRAGVIEWARIDSAFTATASDFLSPSPPASGEAGKGPSLTTRGDGFVIAWTRTVSSVNTVEVRELGVDGSVGCSGSGLGNFASPTASAVADHPSAALTLVLDTNSTNMVTAWLMRSKACTLVDQHPIDTTIPLDKPTPHGAAIAKGDSGYAIVWSRGLTTGQRELHGRFVGVNLCD